MRLARITDSDFSPTNIPQYLEKVSRYSARGILMDENNRVCLLYLAETGFYKLPGGGIEGNETKEQAFLREIREETGYHAVVVSALGTLEEHKYRNNFLQVSHCFLAQRVGSMQPPMLTAHELSVGVTQQWMTYRTAQRLLRRALLSCDDYGMRFMLLRDCRILESAVDYFIS
ncbi:MAG: NUDIX domain-containing protein [Clostridia bacterium]